PVAPLPTSRSVPGGSAAALRSPSASIAYRPRGKDAAAAGRCAFWYAPVVTTTVFGRSSPSDVLTTNPSAIGWSAVTATRSRTGALNERAYDSRCATIASRGMNPSGSSPAYAPPGSRTVQFGVTRQNVSQRPRQVSPTRPRSRTTWSTPAAESSWLTERPACPAPMTTTPDSLTSLTLGCVADPVPLGEVSGAHEFFDLVGECDKVRDPSLDLAVDVVDVGLLAVVGEQVPQICEVLEPVRERSLDDRVTRQSVEDVVVRLGLGEGEGGHQVGARPEKQLDGLPKVPLREAVELGVRLELGVL